ncbi:hypothetical protein J6590_062348 [Homalodisca vitripennis]|nr:hypothetical protein J6590_062348 [Homalodisca vitripennis]
MFHVLPGLYLLIRLSISCCAISKQIRDIGPPGPLRATSADIGRIHRKPVIGLINHSNDTISAIRERAVTRNLQVAVTQSQYGRKLRQAANKWITSGGSLDTRHSLPFAARLCKVLEAREVMTKE